MRNLSDVSSFGHNKVITALCSLIHVDAEGRDLSGSSLKKQKLAQHIESKAGQGDTLLRLHGSQKWSDPGAPAGPVKKSERSESFRLTGAADGHQGRRVKAMRLH